MNVTLGVAGNDYRADIAAAVEVALPFDPQRASGRAFGLMATRVDAVDVGGGRRLHVAAGAAVNCQDLHLNPHGGGCHIEGVGHIARQAVAVAPGAVPSLLPATLLDVPPERLGPSGEHAGGRGDPHDRVITAAAIARALAAVGGARPGFDAAWVLRSAAAPESADGNWSDQNPPYPTREAAAWLAASPARLIVIDLPSFDREDDGGTTPNHALWWGFVGASRELAEARTPDRWLVELAAIPPGLPAGPWLLAIGAPPILADALPASVRLIPVEPQPLG